MQRRLSCLHNQLRIICHKKVGVRVHLLLHLQASQTRSHLKRRTQTYIGRRILTIASICLALGCSKEPLRPDSRFSHLGTKIIVDYSPAWSPDGQFIAYDRAFASSDGPAGVYIISRDGGTPRLVTRGNAAGPRHLRFSPDGSQLVGSWSLRLVIIDVASGTVTFPLDPTKPALFPDWGPDGSIVYVRPFPDSIYVYDPRTGSDRLLLHDGSFLNGNRVRWSRDGTHIALVGGFPPANYPVVLLANADGSTLETLVPPGTLPDYLQWYFRPRLGLDGVIFRDTGKLPSPTYFVPRGGGALVRWKIHMGPYDAVSPDGEMLVHNYPQQPDSLKVLFLMSIDDISGATRRQLTQWTP